MWFSLEYFKRRLWWRLGKSKLIAIEYLITKMDLLENNWFLSTKYYNCLLPQKNMRLLLLLISLNSIFSFSLYSNSHVGKRTLKVHLSNNYIVNIPRTSVVEN